jgi:two-component system, chemotaxis family, chemotaxis protein CheY
VRALIVDDQSNVRLLLSSILRKKIVGCTVSEATNGLEALDLLGRQHFDLVVLDVLMPLMDGIETLEAIRRTPSLRQLPVIVLSAVRDEGRVRQLVGHGISAYLAKPLRPLDVADRIQNIVGRLAVSPGEPSRSLSGIPSGATVLVIDGDAAFRRLVKASLHEYTVREAMTGAEGLRACLEQRPALVIVGQDLGAIAAPVLLRKLRALPDLATARLVAAVPGDATQSIEDADAVVQRTLAGDSFRHHFAKLLVEDTPAEQVLASRAHLRPQMISATEQVFGMMLGIEVFALPVAGPTATSDDVVCVPLRLEREACDLEFLFAAPRSMTERMTAQYLQGEEVVSDADVAATLCEMATIISSRLQTALRQHGDVVSLGEPSVSRQVAGARDIGDGLHVTFASASQDLRFRTTLRAVPPPRPASPAQDAAATASRTPRMDTSSPQPPPVDAEVLEMLESLQEPGEPDLIVELITLFLKDTPDRLAELGGGPLDASHVARVAHAVKGSAGNLGAMVLQECASALEHAAHRGEGPEVLASRADAVHTEFARVERHLEQVLAQRTGTDPRGSRP